MKLTEKITGKISEGKKGIEDKARMLRRNLQGQAEYAFVQKVMKWENVGYDEAVAMCIGKSDPRRPDYILGYRMSDPIMMQALYMQRKKNRERAAENFRQTLATDPDVLELFDQEYKGLGKTFVEAMKERKA